MRWYVSAAARGPSGWRRRLAELMPDEPEVPGLLALLLPIVSGGAHRGRRSGLGAAGEAADQRTAEQPPQRSHPAVGGNRFAGAHQRHQSARDHAPDPEPGRPAADLAHAPATMKATNTTTGRGGSTRVRVASATKNPRISRIAEIWVFAADRPPPLPTLPRPRPSPLPRHATGSGSVVAVTQRLNRLRCPRSRVPDGQR
jgi:hypothetical protein